MDKKPGFFSIFPALIRLLAGRGKRLLNPSTIASIEKSAGATGEKDEALVLLESALERNPHQAPYRPEETPGLNPHGDLLQQVTEGRLFLPSTKDKL